MRTYTAHVKSGRQTVLLREGWSWGAALFGGVWLLFQRAWIPAVLQVALIAIAMRLTPPHLHAPIVLAIVVITGMLGRDMVRWSLERRGYALAHVVAARDGAGAVGRLLTARPDLAPSFLGRR